ncbi:MAG: histidine--tRNA ligase [Candidatus Roizmanbacteria bacterium]|nr:histidine--tRNA ligase [Candidatus Roizmanbacteria bacterium]
MAPAQTLKGFRDILPEEFYARAYVKEKLMAVFEQYGFSPIETPTLEYASLLLGKYGAEADKLIYRFTDAGGREVGLRYDQTVPTARFIAEHREQLPGFFRRYQLQNVFRAEKPQKGRFREFTQCDLDIYGTTSPIADAEILSCTYDAYKAVGFATVVLRCNDRETLITTLSPFALDSVSIHSIIQSIDKLDKIHEEGVVDELEKKGMVRERATEALHAVIASKPSSALKQIMDRAIALGVDTEALVFDPSLARGLDYYTGMIFEVSVPEYAVGSLGGGGRYDKLLASLAQIDMPAVGVGLGFDRIVEAACELNLIPSHTGSSVLVTLFDDESIGDALSLAHMIRKSGVAALVYPEVAPLSKQFKYANIGHVQYVVVCGPDERAANSVTVKNMRSGMQQTIPRSELITNITSQS